jgi:type IV secretory pathway VirB10-like protein
MQADGDGRTRVTQAGGGEGRAAGSGRLSRTALAVGGLVVLAVLAGAIYQFTNRDAGVASQSADQQAAPNASVPAPAPAPTPEPPAPPQTQASAPAAPATPPSKPQESTANTTPAEPARPAAGQQSMSQEPAALPSADTKVIQATRANIRSAPRRRARVVGTVAKGAQVKVRSHSGRWVQIETDGRTGWVNAKLLGARAADQ